jgi:hypothetical protein
MSELERARKAVRIYHKALFLGDWFCISPSSERRAIRAVLEIIPEAVPRGCHGYAELEEYRAQ